MYSLAVYIVGVVNSSSTRFKISIFILRSSFHTSSHASLARYVAYWEDEERRRDRKENAHLVIGLQLATRHIVKQSAPT